MHPEMDGGAVGSLGAVWEHQWVPTSLNLLPVTAGTVLWECHGGFSPPPPGVGPYLFVFGA